MIYSEDRKHIVSGQFQVSTFASHCDTLRSERVTFRGTTQWGLQGKYIVSESCSKSEHIAGVSLRHLQPVLFCVVPERPVGDFQQFGSASSYATRFFQRGQQESALGVRDLFFKIHSALRKASIVGGRIQSWRVGVAGDAV